MSKLFPQKIVISIALLLVAILVGCSHQKTQRGHLFRGDWAFEYNRTPWIGCPPDSGYQEVNEKEPGIRGLLACLSKDGNDKDRKRFRHHCAMNSECSVKEPCSRTLGCGMWVDPNDPTMHVSLGGAARACGLLPFCAPQKPCCLTPNCGRPANVNVNPQTLMQTNQNVGMLGGMPTVRGMSPTGTIPNGMTPTGIIPNAAMPGRAIGAVPGGTLVSRGIVPGASAITSGGMVAAIGVATPAGMMTPVGVRMPNGAVSNAIVLRACVMTPNCTAARPCSLTPNCGGAVAVNMVANNATILASALQAQGVAGGVMQAGGMGMLVNPITNQPISGLTMSGYPQAGYPPIGYAPSGYAPGYPRYAVGMVETGEVPEAPETHREEEVVLPQETRSNMPVPRFHPIPTQPVFQRSEGMAPAQRTTATNHRHDFSEKELEAALDQAYLEGVSAAMDEVERKLEEKRQVVARAKLQEKILQQTESFQQELDAQEEMRMLAMQREQQLQQQALRQQAQRQTEMLAVAMSEPQRLPSPNMVAMARPHQQQSPSQPSPMVAARQGNLANVSPALLAGSLKTSVVSGVNEIFAPLLGSHQRGQVVPATSQPRQHSVQPKSELSAVYPDLPRRPPVSPFPPNYGLLPDDETDSLILQARFADDGVPIRP